MAETFIEILSLICKTHMYRYSKKRGECIMKNISIVLSLILCAAFVVPALSADDPSIKEPLRSEIQGSMNGHVKQNTLNDSYIIYDSSDKKLYELTFKELHPGIVKKGDFYVSCADFTDPEGNLYDVDFLVGESHGNFRVYQAILHKVNGVKRPYDLEDH